MTDRIDRVVRALSQVQDVDLPPGLVAPDAPPDGDDGQDDGYDPGEWAGVADRMAAPDGPAPRDDDPDQPPAARAVDMPLNDFGNGQRLVLHFGDDLLSVPRVGWFLWEGTRFRPDPDGIEVRRRAHRISALIEEEVAFMRLPPSEMEILSEAEAAQEALDVLCVVPVKDRAPDQIEEAIRLNRLVAAGKEIKARRDKSIGRRLTHAKNAGNSNTITNMMAEAETIIARPLEDLDRAPLDINTLGGVLRFSLQPGVDDGGANPPAPVVVVERLEHDRAQLLTKIMPVNLDRGAKCPTFDAFLRRILPNAAMRFFVQRWFGYCMTGLTSEQKFAFFYGSGANGKSVLVDLMARMMGDYAASAKIESLTGRNRRGGGDANPDLVPLIGARFVRTSEPDEGQFLQEGLIKELTGGEPILVRALNENFVLVYPIFKLTISGNHRPEIRGGDDGIWRRVMLVPFEVQIPAEERDPELGAKLWAERDGVMQWLIEGLRDYLAHGLMVPPEVVAATEEYREDSDPLATFLTQVCAVTGRPEHAMKAKDLSEAFAFWLDQGGRGTWTPRTIFKRLKAKAGRWKHPQTGQMFDARKSSDAFYDGIALLEPFRGQFEAHQARGISAAARYAAKELF